MSESEATEIVRVFAAASTYPQLTDNEIALCLSRHVQEDGTWSEEDVQIAVCDAWDIKAGKASDHHDHSVNGRGISASQVIANCERMARWFRRRLPVHIY